MSVAADVTDPGDAERMFRAVEPRWGKVEEQTAKPRRKPAHERAQIGGG